MKQHLPFLKTKYERNMKIDNYIIPLNAEKV